MSTFVLVHGASHGSWCWYKVKMLLEKKGHTVYTPDLPGHDKNNPVSPKEVTLEKYIVSIVDMINTIDENIILVGHSMGGAIISGAMEYVKNRVLKLIYVCALVPQHGDKIGRLINSDTKSQLKDVIIINEQELRIELILDKISNVLFNGCQIEDIEYAKVNLVPQPIIPLETPIEIVMNNYKTVPRIGIVCTADNSISPDYQEQMYRNGGCKTIFIKSGHAPFFSNAEELCTILTSE